MGAGSHRQAGTGKKGEKHSTSPKGRLNQLWERPTNWGDVQECKKFPPRGTRGRSLHGELEGGRTKERTQDCKDYIARDVTKPLGGDGSAGKEKFCEEGGYSHLEGGRGRGNLQ